MIRSKISQIVTNISNVTSQPTLVNDAIEIALQRVYQWFDWPYYMQEGTLQYVADYSVGTANVTNGSTTVTITTGVVSASFLGRKFRASNEKPYYRITAVNTVGNTITLAYPYQGTNNATATYDIFKDEYRLVSDVDKYKTLRQIENGIPMWSITPNSFDERFPTPQSLADPLYEMMIGTKLDTYTTGTVTCTGTTITGIGTAWTSVEALGRMSLIRIGNNVYTIKSVDSDTQITTYESTTTVSVATSYEITLNNLVVQLYQIPNANRLIYYRYFRQPVPLVNDYDIPDMPHDFHWLLIYGALSFIYLQKGDINKAQIESEQRFIDGLNMMKLKLGSFAPNRIISRRSVDNMNRRRRFDALEASNFDRRYSL